jgi:hypothetical protein
MISKHIFTSDVVSGKQLWINGLNSTGDLIVASTNFDIENNLKVGEDLSIGGNSVLSGNANISGDLYVGQNLTVKGTTTTLDTVNVTVDDHNIELGSVDNPTNITAEGGGITLKGDQDKTFNWQANYNGSWLSSENLGVADGKYVFTDKVRARDGAGLFLEDDGGNGIFIEDGGNVGIGTASPDHKLHIAGGTPSMKLEGSQPRIWLRETDQTDLNTLIRNNNGIFEIDTVEDGDTYIQNRFAINHGNGNVRINDLLGIGKDPDGYHLDVAAPGASANGIRVQTNNDSSNAIVHIGGGGSADIKFKVDGEGSVTTAKDVTIGGNLTVNGTTTTVNSTTVTVDDKNIELGSVASPTNTTADGGGVTLKGATDKEFKWTNASNAWNSSEHLGIADGKYLFTDKVRARDGAGLFLEDDGGNGIFIEDGGNVGIGTTTPDSLLEIAGDINPELRITDTNPASASAATFRAEDGGVTLGSHSNHSLYLVANNSTKMTIMSNGNVGIGRTDPSYKFEVKSENLNEFAMLARRADNKLLGGIYQDSTGCGTFGLYNTSETAKVWLNTNGNSYLTGGNVGIGTVSPAAKLEVKASESRCVVLDNDKSGGFLDLRSSGTNQGYLQWGMTPAGADTGDDLLLTNTTANGGFAVTKGSVAQLYVKSDGNVGIGTTSPLAKLDIRTKGDTPNDGLIVKTEDGGGRSVRMWVDGSTQKAHIGGGVGTEDLILNHAGGNVGIGATSPDVELDVNGTIKASDELIISPVFSAGNNVSRIYDNSGELRIETQIYADTTADSSPISFGTSDSSGRQVRMRINSDGNVGIGTTNPASEVDISKASGGESVLSITSAGVQRHQIIQKGTGDGDLVFYNQTADAERMRIASNGNVGIGATADLTGLQLGTALVVSSATGGDIVAHRSGSSVNVGDICGSLLISNSDTDGAEDHFVGMWGKASSTNGSQDLHLAAGRSGYEVDAPHMTINSDGNVGIGTTSPDHKLHVDGGDIKISSDSHTNNGDGLPALFFCETPNTGDEACIVYNGDLVSGPDNYLGLGVYDITNTSEDTVAEKKLRTTLNITRDGNVGIGTTSPDEALHVKTTTPAVQILAERSNAQHSLFSAKNSRASDNQVYFGITPDGNFGVGHSLDVATDGSFFIQPDGNVGIGTTSPLSRLHIPQPGTTIGGNDLTKGCILLGSSAEGVAIDNNEIIKKGPGATSSFVIGNANSEGDILLRTNQADRVIISNSTTTVNNVLQAHGGMTIATNEDNDTPELTLKRTSATNPGGNDDIVDIRVADSSLNFIINNNSDGGGGTYNFRKVLSGLEVPAPISCDTITTNGIIRKNGDTNTYLEFHSADRLRLVTGGVQQLEVTNSGLFIQDNIKHTGDDNTYFGFHNNDQWRVVTSGTERLEVTNTAIALKRDTAITGGLTISGNLTVTGKTITNDVEVVSTSNGVVFEGSVADDHQGLLKAGALTADRTYTLPNQSGTVAMTSDIKNSAITITAGNALTGGGTLNLNQSSAETITINHQDTSAASSVNNSGRTYIQDIGLDGYGHVTSLASATASNATVTVTAGGAMTGGGSFTLDGTGGTITLNHQDTSSQGSSNNSGRTYIQDISLDAYGHVTSIGTATETVVDTNTTYSTATSSTSGLVKIGYTENGKNYPVELSSGKMFVNVPWVDTNTNTQRTDAEIRTAVGGSFPSFSSAENGKVLKVDGGNLSWKDDDAGAATSPGGSDHQVQFNNNGSFGGSANLTFDGANLYAWQGDIVAYAASDKRLKNNISNISSPIEKIKQINGVNFEWSDKQSAYAGKDVGVIAQEVEKVLPEVVAEREDGHLAVKYEKIIPLLIEAIKDQQKEIEELKSKLS